MSAGATGSFLSRLAHRERVLLEAAGVRRVVRSGGTLFWEGSPSDSAVVVLAGQVKVAKVAPGGREALIELRGPGDLVGELGAIDGSPRSASVVAVTDVTALCVPASRFRELLSSEVRIANAVLELVMARLRRASDRQLELGTSDAVSRVCARLLELVAWFGRPAPDVVGAVIVDSPISQQELADWVGVSRDGVVRALQILRGSGILTTSRQRFVLLDLAAIRSFAAGESR